MDGQAREKHLLENLRVLLAFRLVLRPARQASEGDRARKPSSDAQLRWRYLGCTFCQ